jgi:hypothetical protein
MDSESTPFIRVIPAIRGKIFARTSGSEGLQCKEHRDKNLCCFFFAIFVFSCGKFFFGSLLHKLGQLGILGPLRRLGQQRARGRRRIKLQNLPGQILAVLIPLQAGRRFKIVRAAPDGELAHILIQLLSHRIVLSQRIQQFLIPIVISF